MLYSCQGNTSINDAITGRQQTADSLINNCLWNCRTSHLRWSSSNSYFLFVWSECTGNNFRFSFSQIFLTPTYKGPMRKLKKEEVHVRLISSKPRESPVAERVMRELWVSVFYVHHFLSIFSLLTLQFLLQRIFCYLFKKYEWPLNLAFTVSKSSFW